jgi:hypothetical protein
MPQQVANNMSRSLGNAPQQQQQEQQQEQQQQLQISTDEAVQVTPEELAQARSVDEQQAQLAGYGTMAPPVPVSTEGVSSSSKQLSSTKPVEAEPAVATAAKWVRSVQGDSSTTDGTTATGTTATDTAAGTGGGSSAGTGTGGEQQVHKEEQHQQQGGLLNTLTNLVFGEKGHHPENETAITAAGQPPAPKA